MEKITSMDDYTSQYSNSLAENDAYWASVAKNLHWFQPFSKVSSGDFNDLEIKWFEDGTTNLS